jgi:hypothetical protein
MFVLVWLLLWGFFFWFSVQAVQGPQGERWSQEHPIHCDSWWPHHPLPWSPGEGQRHHQAGHCFLKDRGLHQVWLWWVWGVWMLNYALKLLCLKFPFYPHPSSRAGSKLYFTWRFICGRSKSVFFTKGAYCFADQLPWMYSNTQLSACTLFDLELFCICL